VRRIAAQSEVFAALRAGRREKHEPKPTQSEYELKNALKNDLQWTGYISAILITVVTQLRGVRKHRI